MKYPLTIAAIALAALMPPAEAAALREGGDPLDSARWGEMARTFLAGAPVVFDPRVKVIAPATAENFFLVPKVVE